MYAIRAMVKHQKYQCRCSMKWMNCQVIPSTRYKKGMNRCGAKDFTVTYSVIWRILSLARVNSLEGVPFMETALPSLLMQDLSIVGMFAGPDIEGFSKPTGIDVKSLDDWHGVIDWWFDKYGTYATAVKTQNAYSRNIDYEDIPAEKVSQAFKNIVNGVNIESDQRKNIEDHLFWYACTQSNGIQPAGKTSYRLLCRPELYATEPSGFSMRVPRLTSVASRLRLHLYSCISAIRITRS